MSQFSDDNNGTNGTQNKPFWNRRTKITAGLIGSALMLWLLWGQLFVTNMAGYYMVIQDPFTGSLNWKLTPGLKWRGFGKVTTYPQRDQFWFSSKGEKGRTDKDESIRIRFNDGGYASVSGSVAWEMPDQVEQLNKLHNKYRSIEAIEQQLMRTVMERSIYLSGPMMSSTESFAARRNELLHVVEDQVENGAYETETFRDRVKDPITGELKTVDVVRIKVVDGNPVHAVDSPLREFGLRTFNLSMNEIKYDGPVENQIKAQQKAAAAVQIATAEAKQAEQDKITAEKKGLAKAAEAKWAKEVDRIAATVAAEKERDVANLLADQEKQVAELNATKERDVQLTAAQRDFDVAQLKLQTAENTKKAAVARGEGVAKARELVMAADGALTKKLSAWLEVQQAYAAAIAGYKGSWVPNVVTSGTTGPGTPASQQQLLTDLLTIKTAQDLQQPAQPKPQGQK